MSEKSSLAALDHQYLWHPFTQMKQWREQTPLIIERAKGAYLYDLDGNQYIDGSSSLWCNIHGHCVAEINQAIIDQLAKVAHSTLLGLSSPPSILLAEKLVSIAPQGSKKLTKVFYSDDGSTAVEAALKIAVGYWYHRQQQNKTKFIAFRGSYHGDTIGSISVGESDVFNLPYTALKFPTFFAPSPSTAFPPKGFQTPINLDRSIWPSEQQLLNQNLAEYCISILKNLLDQHSDQLAGIIIEPIMQAAAGMISHPPGFLKEVSALAQAYNVLLIVDEVATGFGRTGKMFACEHEKVVPDILCLAKGLSGGYLPLAATLTTEEIEQTFYGEPNQLKAFFHGHTYTGNALACSAALASLNLFNQNNLLRQINISAENIKARLEDLKSCNHIFDIRQRGLMIGVDLRTNNTDSLALDYSNQLGHEICKILCQKGLLIRPLGNILVLMPIPAMNQEILDQMLDIFIETVLKFRA